MKKDIEMGREQQLNEKEIEEKEYVCVSFERVSVVVFMKKAAWGRGLKVFVKSRR